MIGVETFVEFVKKKDLGRIKFAIRETRFDLDASDEEGRTVLHHAIINGIEEGQLQMAKHLIGFGSDVNIRDETLSKESPLHIALRMESIEAVRLLLEATPFDVVKCDVFRRQMVLRSHNNPNGRNVLLSCQQETTDDAQPEAASTGDEPQRTIPADDRAFLLIVRENISSVLDDFLKAAVGAKDLRLTDIVLLQDECYITPLHDVLRFVDRATLTAVYIVDCCPQLEEDDIFAGLRLRTLVLSNAHLRRLPASLFLMDCLEVLKVDRNGLEDIPEDIVRLKNLHTFCCDRQRPRLRILPSSICKIHHIQMLSISSNRIEDISWVATLSSLRTFRCDRNRISRLPTAMANLRELVDLDVSHNRLTAIPPILCDLVSRLYRFGYYNITLRPRYVLHDVAQLLVHLELEHFVEQTGGGGRPSVRDVTVAVVGETLSGKTTLAEAFNAGCFTSALSSSSSKTGSTDLQSAAAVDAYDGCGGSGGEPCFLSAIELFNGVMDAFSRNLSVDLYLLAVDLTAIQPHNGCQHLFARHVNRIQMWLQAIYELSPDTPVVLVGTHADQVRPTSLADVWAIVERLLDSARPHHARRYADSRIANCLLCLPRQQATRRTATGKGGRTQNNSSGTGTLGFVDLSLSYLDPTPANGHVPVEESHQPPGRHRFPHVVGYYEVETKKFSSRTPRKTSVSLERLKEAVVRLTSYHHQQYRIPRSWVKFIRQAVSFWSSDGGGGGVASGMPFISYDMVKSLSKSCEVPPTHVQHMLHFFHRRGKLVYFGSNDILSRLVVVNTSWFIHRLSQVMDVHLSSRCSSGELLQLLTDKEIDGHLQKMSAADQQQQQQLVLSSEWLLAALQKLEMCIVIQSIRDEKLFLLPNLLEYGSPSHDVWPDNPEWEEKQITCDFGVRFLKPGLFSDLILRINCEGRRLLKIVSDPVPVFLSHHIVFFSAFDQGGCDDCYSLRRRLRAKQRPDDAAAAEISDDVLHKVHIMLHSRMDAVRVQVRGIGPCCTTKAVLGFLELYLDDAPEEDYETASDGASFSSQTTSSASPSASASALYSSSDGHGSFAASLSRDLDDDDCEDRDLFLLCSKCVLLRHSHPGRVSYNCLSPKRKAICRKWQNSGTWCRGTSGDYRFSSVIEVPPTASLTILPDYEHPRLVLILPPSPTVSNKDWYMFSRMKFLEGFEVHFLCEYTGFWHLTEDAGFRLNQSSQFTKTVGNQLPVLLNLALPLIQTIQGIPEHANNGRLVAPMVSDLIKVYDYLRSVDPHIHDIYHWLSKNKDRVVNMLTKVLAAAGDGMPDLYFKVNNSINAHAIFQAPSSANRCLLARYLHIDATSGRFGSLRPLYVEGEIRWVCETHYEELRNVRV